jgi:hypothetical protein
MRPLCPFAQAYQSIVQETIKLTDQTTVSQYKAAQESLDLLYRQLAARMTPFHFPAIATASPHYCLKDAWEEARIRLRNLAMLSPKPAPAPPAPRDQRIQALDVVSNLDTLAERLTRLPTETFFGEEERQDDPRTTQ